MPAKQNSLALREITGKPKDANRGASTWGIPARQTYCIPAPKAHLHFPAPETRRRRGTLLKQRITNTNTPLNLYRESAPGPRSSPTVRRPMAVATETRNELRALREPEGGSLGTSPGAHQTTAVAAARQCSSYAPSPVV